MRKRFYGKPKPAKRDVSAALDFYNFATSGADNENDTDNNRHRKRLIEAASRLKLRNKK